MGGGKNWGCRLAQWYSVCIACIRPQVLGKEGRERGKKLHIKAKL
jgi:hypothetical protein